MFKIFKTLFGKPETPPAVVLPRPVPENTTLVGKVETAALSLAAILARFPQELTANIAKMPDSPVMVVLPLSTILKQLPTGSVKMSLASIYRQAPGGTFTATRMEEKRMVEVPLGEVFKQISPGILKRRTDQRMHELVQGEGFDLFSDTSNPFSRNPTGSGEAVQSAPVTALSFAPALDPVPTIESIAPAPGMIEMIPPLNPPAAPEPMRTIPPPPGFAGAAAAPVRSLAGPTLPALVLVLAEISGSWPEEVLSEIAALIPANATVTLPGSEVSAGLAKGKVTFSWGQLRSWITPAVSDPAQAREVLELQLPLRVVAPAFLKVSKSAGERKRLSVDESIPSLFVGGPEKKPSAPEMSAATSVEMPELKLTPPEPVESEAEVAEPLAPEELEPAPTEPVLAESVAVEPMTDGTDPEEAVLEMPAPLEPEPLVESAPLTFEFAPEPVADEVAEPEELATPLADPNLLQAPELMAAMGPPQGVTDFSSGDATQPTTIGEIFGQPDKENWSPSEIVAGITLLPQVAGAVVALQEGLVVAHSLPEPMKGDVVAAFLPQIFSRLNQYSGEMKLGELDELLMCTHGSYLQIYRLGFVFFAVLGNKGESLPWNELRLIAEELARQAQK